MRVKFAVLLAAILAALHGANTAIAESRWSNTSGGTLDWNVSGNWSGTFPPAGADDVRITNDLSIAQTITNMGGNTAIGATNTINFLAVSNGVGSTPVTVIQAPGVFWRTSFGFQIGKNATVILTTNAIMGTNQFFAFNLRAGGQPGTLILSNASPTSGISTFVNNGGGTGIFNAGTIQLTPNGNQLVSLNYGQVNAFTNDALGTVVMKGSGTGAFIGNFGANNRAFINNGSILVNAGTLRIDSRDAFSRGGFQNGATGYVRVDTGSVFELRRTINAWGTGPAPTNFGTVFLNGGNLVAVDTDTSATNVSRIIANLGTIGGNGTILASINNRTNSFLSPGASIGTLNVGGNVTFGSNSTFVVELGLLAGQNDLLQVSSNLTLSIGSILNISGGAIGNIYTVATAFAVSGTFSTVTPGYLVSYDPTDIRVEVVPEPATLLLVGGAVAALVTVRRRRRRA